MVRFHFQRLYALSSTVFPRRTPSQGAALLLGAAVAVCSLAIMATLTPMASNVPGLWAQAEEAPPKPLSWTMASEQLQEAVLNCRDVSTPYCYKQIFMGSATLHSVIVPPRSNRWVIPGYMPLGETGTTSEVSTMMTVDEFADIEHADVVINGGYFDPNNGKTASWVDAPGLPTLNPRENERLVNNQGLAPYLEQFFTRTEFKTYQCGQDVEYTIEPNIPGSAAMASRCTLKGRLGGGPLLVPQFRPEEEAFYKKNSQGNVVRDPVGVYQANARSAVGVMKDGTVVFLMAAQDPSRPGSRGLSLQQLARLYDSVGAQSAMGLDGGSSSSLWLNGKTWWGKYTAKGSPIKRRVRSVLMVVPQSDSSER